MPLALHDNQQDTLTVTYEQQQLFQYVYKPQTALQESPKPYFHPLATLRGDIVTDFRPDDHTWHHGLAMTCAYLSGTNFWGGPTYQQDQGYVWGDDHGSQIHQYWSKLDVNVDTIYLVEQLHWLNYNNTPWLQEERTIAVHAKQLTSDFWTLAVSTRLRNISDQTLSFGSPTTQGRPLAGYGGLFWRGPQHYLHGDILTSTLQGPDILGAPAPWLAYRTHTANPCTLVFIDHKNNPRSPNQWFVRNTPYVGASFAFMFDQPYALPPQSELHLQYHIVIAHTALSQENIEHAVTLISHS